jgi:hypothetical protein
LSFTAYAHDGDCQSLGLSISRISRILAEEAMRQKWDIFCNVVDNFGTTDFMTKAFGKF